MQPIAVAVDGKGIFGQVGVIHPIGLDAFPARPASQVAGVLAQTVGQRLQPRIRRDDSGRFALHGHFATRHFPHPHRAGQGPIGDLKIRRPRAAQQRSRLRQAADHRRAPARKGSRQPGPQRRMQGARCTRTLQPLAIGRIGDHQPGADLARRRGLRQVALRDTHAPRQSSAVQIGLGQGNDSPIGIAARNRRQSGQSRDPPRLGIASQPLPQRRHVALPALETVIGSQQARRDVRRDPRPLDQQRAGAAHRIEQGPAIRRDGRPTGLEQQRRRQRFLQRRGALLQPVGTAMQAFPCQIQVHRRLLPEQMHRQADIGALGTHAGAPAGTGAEAIDDAILHREGTEMGVADGL